MFALYCADGLNTGPESENNTRIFGDEPLAKSWKVMMPSAGCHVDEEGVDGFCAYSLAFAPNFTNYDPKDMEYS